MNRLAPPGAEAQHARPGFDQVHARAAHVGAAEVLGRGVWHREPRDQVGGDAPLRGGGARVGLQMPDPLLEAQRPAQLERLYGKNVWEALLRNPRARHRYESLMKQKKLLQEWWRSRRQ